MQNKLLSQAEKFEENRKHHKSWLRIVSALACVVVFITTYMLILPAVTLEQTAYCGSEEHLHSDACYEEALVCGYDETGETAHIHSDECYQEQQTLICRQDESSGHIHDESCVSIEKNLICAEDHEHTDSCYEATEAYTCGMNEGDGAHTHSSECYEITRELICGETESEHVHTEDCYEKTLVCQLEEHEHSLVCYANPDADVESASVWERSVSGAELTGIWADDVAAVAQTQLGYEESTQNYTVTEDGEMKGITRYGQWYGDPYGDWDAMFVSFCLNYAGIPQTAVPYGADCAAWAGTLSYAGLYRSANTYSPEKGDIVFFDYNGDGAADHVGIVAQISEGGAGFRSVEGDVDNLVQQIGHSADESGIVGYAALPENPNIVPEDSGAQDEDMPAGDADAADDVLTAEEPDDEQEKSEDEDLTSDGFDVPANVLAEENSGDDAQIMALDDSAESIAVGESKTVNVEAGETVKLQFVPEYTHQYVCYSSTSGDTYGHLYNADGKQIAYNDDTHGNGNFEITYTLTGGETYYWGVRWYSSTKSGDIAVSLVLGDSHTYTENEQGALVCVCGGIPSEAGQCGDDLYWSFDKETGTLSITGSGAMYNYTSSANVPWAPFSDRITNVVIGEGATSLGNNAFANCSSLETASFPSTLNRLGSYAFSGCAALTEADLSGTGITSISERAFFNCTCLQTVNIPGTLTSVEKNAFYGCKALAEVDLSGTGVTSIGTNAFQNCSSMQQVSFPETLTGIGSYAFSGCKALAEVDLSGTGVTSIDTNAFQNCSSMQQVSFPETLTGIGSYAFSGCNALTEVDLSGTGVTSIGTYAFQNCSSMQQVSFPQTLTTIGNYAFYRCAGLSEIVLPEAVGSVGQYAFRDCNSITELRLEAENITIDSTQTATKNGFHVTVAETVENLSAEAITALANMGCSGISFAKSVYLAAGDWQADFLPDQLNGLPQSEYFIDENGVFYRIDSETNTASVFYCPPGITSYTVLKELPAVDGKETTIPVTGVDSDAFSDASDLTTLTFEEPASITTLADMAFYRAVNLETINGQSTDEAVLATFPSDQLKTGTMLFWQTKITHSGEQPEGEEIGIEKESLKLTVSTSQSQYRNPTQSDNATYLYYTGETAKTTVTVSNPDSADYEEGTVVRVYFRFDEAGGKLNYSPGTYTVVSTTGNQHTMTVAQADAPGCYYVELERPKQGDTISINLESSYPSPTSGGGDAVLWCDVLTAEEKASVGNGLIPVGNHQSMNWSTIPDTFPVTKKEKSTGASKLTGDGNGDAYISGVSYTIEMSRQGTTLEGVGKDYMCFVDFEDVLTLPEGVILAEDVVQSIRNGTVQVSLGSGSQSGGYTFKTAEGRSFLTLQPSNPGTNYQYLQYGEADLDENGNLIIRWRFRNADMNTEIGDITFTYTVSGNTLVVPSPQEEKTYVLNNVVTAQQHFMYSADQLQQDEASATVQKASSSLKLTKTISYSSSNYGSSRTYRITAQNPGALPYERLAYLTDDLPVQEYMTPSDLAATFAEDTEHQLTITIVNATTCEPTAGSAITGIDGKTGETVLQNTGNNTEYNGMSGTDPDTTGYETATITISWAADNQLQISMGDGQTFLCEPSEDGIQSILQRLGFVVTAKTQYCLKWDLRNADGTVPPLCGGGQIQKNVYCACKDTFMLLANDTLNQHPTSSQSVRNTAYGRDADGKSLTWDYSNMTCRREFYLDKNWTLDGETVDAGTTIRQGDILDYTLNVTHNGIGEYEALPLVDHMSGTQALLVPAAKNSGADWAGGLTTVTEDGVEYYVLLNPGTYRNVWTSEDQLADTVEVTQTDSGLDTLIKWYFVNYTGNRTDAVTYRSYVCPNETATGSLTYSLGNECWLNDHQSHRLYAALTGWQGTTFDFNKVIVDNVGDTGTGYRHSLVSEGQTVVYRLMLRSSVDTDGNALPMTITGAQMYDALPLSNSTYRWAKENIRITYNDDYTVANGDHWTVAEPEAGDQQYIQWADDFSMTFTGRAYIYVELDFPTGIPWQEYAVKYGTTTLVNTYHVLSAQRSVTHEVSTAGQVYLQKGVYTTGYFYRGNTGLSYYKSDMSLEDDRLYYQNNDAKTRAVRYYVSLYNAGPTNLYLTDMQDLLPRGFTYADSTGFTTVTTTSTAYNQIKAGDGSAASKMFANVTVTKFTDENGRQHVSFHFSQSSSTSAYPVAYDEDRGMCYLKPGEALDFTYVCKTNEALDTDDAALNIVTMPYYDFNNGGVVVDHTCSVISVNSNKYTPNDGGCDVLDNGTIEGLGFTGGTDDTQWLTSQVTLIRGDIKPGITKELTSKTDQNGVTTQNPVSAASTDTLNWTIKTENDGTSAILDYVLTDRMQKPYMFTGKVSYTIYGSPSSNSLVARPASDYLFTIANGADDGTLSIKTNRGVTRELVIGADPVTLSCSWNYSLYSSTSTSYYTKDADVQLSIAQDAEGNAILSLRFPDETMAIPENGYSLLTLSTYNASNTLENRQFINTCFITPLAQRWDNTTNKGNIVTLETPFSDGELSTVRNSAPVTTSYGYVTSSSKCITEVDDPGNTAACTDDPNYIVLADEKKLFRYTITVNNSTPKALDMLVLIDGLPEVDDHTAFLTSDPRFSEFKVSLADDPGFTVTVTEKDGTVKTLDAGSYTIEYSPSTEFTAADWKGTSQWSASAENARSIRLQILDASGTLIPSESTVSLSFTCKIDDPNAQPGQIAWNSFGYHYSLMDEASELEAAPLKVGVKIPSVPELRKQVVDHSGQPRTVEHDETFRFLVYQGAALSGEYTTREEWITALGDTPYEEVSVTVKAGESLSESVRLVTDLWKWTEGQQYTIVELPCDENYAFRRFLNSTAGSYTLTYTPAQTQIVTCENFNLRWRIDLTKENTSHEPLNGAVFALYSPDSSDQLSAVPEAYAGCHVALTVEYKDQIWYLVDIQTTREDGKLNWSDLLREQYYLLEVKAPDGYNLNSPAGQIVKQENETQGLYAVTVVNRTGASLPETGGMGTHPYMLGGLLLMLSAGVLLLYNHTKRRKGDSQSS